MIGHRLPQRFYVRKEVCVRKKKEPARERGETLAGFWVVVNGQTRKTFTTESTKRGGFQQDELGAFLLASTALLTFVILG